MGLDGGGSRAQRWQCKPPRRKMMEPEEPGVTRRTDSKVIQSLRVRARSAPPSSSRRRDTSSSTLGQSLLRRDLDIPLVDCMQSAPAVDRTLDDDPWKTPSVTARLYRAASVGNSWGVTSIGRGFDWAEDGDPSARKNDAPLPQLDIEFTVDTDSHVCKLNSGFTHNLKIIRPVTNILHAPQSRTPPSMFFTKDSLKDPPDSSSPSSNSPSRSPALFHRPPLPSRSPSSPRSRRRSSQQRVSLIAGRVSIAPMEPPSPPLMLPPSLHRAGSSGSLLSLSPSSGPSSPVPPNETFLGGRSISDFVIEGDIGRGAYGLVKRGREINTDGSLGPPLVIKQIIKSRILADCWKKHPKHGTIPIEIYVMSAISNISYVLPPRRAWDPSRLPSSLVENNTLNLNPNSNAESNWIEGVVVKGHPNICPLLDFFEDNHYYYLVLPSTTPQPQPNMPPPPADLFDLVESHPQGLSPSSVRSYLGQIADALSFLHAQGIVHRDVKDENVVLCPDGKCILIDFGSSGLVKKGGWDTFSGTLDYAGPEILRGERYYGKEQDVWAFGIVAFVLLVGECPFMTAAEAQDGLESPFSNASISLDERCVEGKDKDGEEADGGGCLGDAAALVRACLQVEVVARPTFDRILQSRFLMGDGGWGMEDP